MRLDKFLCEMNIGSRSQVKTYIKQKFIMVNGEVAMKPEQKIDEFLDIVTFKGEQLIYEKFSYYLLNKPKGVVSATCDNTASTVLELLPSDRKKDLFPVGRLDKDTEGLLLITNDGELAHRLLSPKNHVKKTYLVQIKNPLSQEDITQLCQGVDIGEEKLTLPAKVRVLEPLLIELTIHEGKFHQVKRMLKAVDNEVLELKRIRFGSLVLEETLQSGESRRLTQEEVCLLKQVALESNS